MSMLLALATAFTLFTLDFSATQEQHIQDIVTYSTGADFSAELPSPQTTPAQTDNLTTLQSDPLFLVLDGVLILGTVIALLVALAGDILSSWLSARTRLMSFVTLQALGTTPAQVASVVTWEQVIVSATGLLLGVGFGVLLIASVIPSLTFTDLNANLSSTQFFALQSALTARIVVPPSLPLVLLIFAGILVTAIAIMVRVVSRPALDRVLRLDES